MCGSRSRRSSVSTSSGNGGAAGTPNDGAVTLAAARLPVPVPLVVAVMRLPHPRRHRHHCRGRRAARAGSSAGPKRWCPESGSDPRPPGAAARCWLLRGGRGWRRGRLRRIGRGRRRPSAQSTSAGSNSFGNPSAWAILTRIFVDPAEAAFGQPHVGALPEGEELGIGVVVRARPAAQCPCGGWREVLVGDPWGCPDEPVGAGPPRPVRTHRCGR